MIVIAEELVNAIRKNMTFDGTERAAVRYHLLIMVRRPLKRYGYLLDMQDKATQTMLKRVNLLCVD